jgi:hypothetical protein
MSSKAKKSSRRNPIVAAQTVTITEAPPRPQTSLERIAAEMEQDVVNLKDVYYRLRQLRDRLAGSSSNGEEVAGIPAEEQPTNFISRADGALAKCRGLHGSISKLFEDLETLI